MPAGNDLERALHVFIHDLRAPISVAQGYLRLVRENRLPDEATRERALAQSVDSLARLSSLCDDAAEYLAVHESSHAAAAPCPVPQFLQALDRRLSELAIGSSVTGDGARLLVGAVGRADVMADRIATVAALAKRHDSQVEAAIAVDSDGEVLRIVCGTASQRDALGAGEVVAIDRWRGGMGLKLALACLDLERHGARVWTTAEGWPGVGLALPLQTEVA